MVSAAAAAASFLELADFLGWSDKTRLYMLWACVDDSGVRVNGVLRRYALGGGVAQANVWAAIRPLWQARLEDPSNPSKVAWFHYREWKRAYLGHAKPEQPFFGWSQPQLIALLSDLTRLISKHEINYLCGSVQTVQSRRAVRDSYKKVTEYVLLRSGQIADRSYDIPDKISFLFSMQAELPGIRIQNFFSKLKRIHPEYGECVIRDPRDDQALQVADLIVNEMATSRYMRASFGPEFRMPFITNMMQLLRQEPPYHAMIEYHPDDDLGLDN